MSEERSGKSLLGHDVVEVIKGHGGISVGVGAVYHFLQLLIGHGLAQLASDTAQIAERDSASAVVVEETEHFADVLVGHAGSHHVEELLEVNVSTLVLVEVSDHLV